MVEDSLKELAVTGTDLIALGIPPGRELGMLLKELLEAVLEKPALNTREELLRICEDRGRRFSDTLEDFYPCGECAQLPVIFFAHTFHPAFIR